MHTLFLDFASHQKVMVLLKDHALLRMETVEGRIAEEDILPMMERVLGAPLASIDGSELRIATITGPGGFMSIRTGMSIINTLAWSKHIPLAGIHLSEMWGTRISCHRGQEARSDCSQNQEKLPATSHKPQAFLWLHSTKRELFFIRGFGDFAKDFPEPNVIKFDDLQKFCNAHENIPFVGEILDDQRALLPTLTETKDVQPLKEVLPLLLSTLAYDQKVLEPWYGRGA